MSSNRLENHKEDDSNSPSKPSESTLGHFGHTIAQEVEDATAKWMKMISSTFLGETSTSTYFSSRKSLTSGTRDVDEDEEVQEEKKNQVKRTIQLKIALVGGTGVGKTTILRRWLERPYQSKYNTTIGVDVCSFMYKYKNKKEIQLDIWDVSSVEIDNQSSLHTLLCDQLDGIFFVFNVHRVSSIAAIDKWRQALSKYISAKEIPFFLLSHKADLLQKRVMTSDDIAAYARASGYKGWMWTVGRSGFGDNDKYPAVQEALDRMVEHIVKQKKLFQPDQPKKIFSKQMSLFGGDQEGRPVSVKIVQTDDSIHRFSTSLLRIPMKAITTFPREDHPQLEDRDQHQVIEKQQNVTELKKQVTKDQIVSPVSFASSVGGFETTRSSFAGDWMLGENKGVYLTVTDESVLTKYDSEEEEEEEEEGEEEKDKEKKNDVDELEKEQNKNHEDQKEEENTTEEAEDDAPTVRESNLDAKEQDEHLEKEKESEDIGLKSPVGSQSQQEEEDCWRFFAGTIDRVHAEAILKGRPEGSFLLRRKDANTLILSYMGEASTFQIHHALIEFSNQRYHVGSSKTSKASFLSLSKCLRSVRKYAYRGLVFKRSVYFRVATAKKTLSSLAQVHEEDEENDLSASNNDSTQRAWRTRAVSSGSSASISSTTTSTPNRSPRCTKQTHRSSVEPGLQAKQEEVKIPPKERIDQLSISFYEQLETRLKHFDTLSAKPLLEILQKEKQQGISKKKTTQSAELQWRQLVKNMDTWNRIVMNMELSTFK